MSSEAVRVPADPLRRFTAAAFERVGVPPSDAELVADALVEADLRGVETHGLVRLPAYLKRIQAGLVNPTPANRIVAEKGGIAILDGDNGLGQVSGARAMDRAVALAREHGLAFVGIRRSTHLGALAWTAMRALPEMIGLAASSTNPVMAPWGGVEALVGNNPMAVAIPAGDGGSMVLDIAMSQVARGHVILAQKRRERIPLTWAMDREGRPTDDPDAAMAGSLLPMGGHKGYGLALVVAALAAVLAGSPVGSEARSLYDMGGAQNFGHCVLAMDPGACGDRSAFRRGMAEMIAALKSSPRAPGVTEILVPGEKEERARRERLALGIPIEPFLQQELRDVAKELGLSLPAEMA